MSKTTKKANAKTKAPIRQPVRTIDQLTLNRLIAQKFEMTIASVSDIILEWQKLIMTMVKNNTKIILKNFITLEAREYKGKEWKSPLDNKVYNMDDRKRVLVRIGEGFKHYLNDDQKTDDRLCRFIAENAAAKAVIGAD